MNQLNRVISLLDSNTEQRSQTGNLFSIINTYSEEFCLVDIRRDADVKQWNKQGDVRNYTEDVITVYGVHLNQNTERSKFEEIYSPFLLQTLSEQRPVCE